MRSLKFLVRLDDITPYMDRIRFNKVREILDKYGICPIIGVVPDCRDESIYSKESEPYSLDEFKALLKELTNAGWTVAMHGTNHVYSTDDSGLLGINPFSEFAGTSYAVQYTKLKQGRDILRRLGVTTTLFMAPGHTFDENTLRALKSLGFNSVTDGLYHKPYIRDEILFVPCTLVAMNRMKDFDTICLHPNNMTDKEMNELDKFICRHKDEAVRFDEERFRSEAAQYSEAVAFAEAGVLKMRLERDKVANSPKLSAFLADTDHPNKTVKWMKRAVMSPLLLTGKYGKN